MRRFFALVLSAAWLSAVLGALLDWTCTLDLTRLPAVGTEVLDRNGRILALRPARDGVWRFRADPARLAPALTGLLIRVEDRGFQSDALRLLFPSLGAALSADGPVTIRAMGGRRPLSFLVDGRAIAGHTARRTAGLQPPGSGFYHITVLDAEGAAVGASVQVRLE
jgi:membrane carboxypeptidase/penicillin-binding protein PbpC